MHTLRARHTLTETDDLARALDDAALAWPELRGDRGALLRKLVEIGRLRACRWWRPWIHWWSCWRGNRCLPAGRQENSSSRMARVIVLNANVLIGFPDSSDPHRAASIELLGRRFVDRFASSVLTFAEALVHPTRVDRQDARRCCPPRCHSHGIRACNL